MAKIKKMFPPKVRIGIFVVLVVLVVAFPYLVSSQYLVRIGTLCLMYSALALSLNLVTGFMGQVSLGHAAFFGVGAYTSAILSDRLAWSFTFTALAALLVAGIFGALLGIPALKMKGSYLSIVSLGFCEIIRLVELNWVSLTRGPMGMTGIARPSFFGLEIRSVESFYFLCLVLVIIVCFIVANITGARSGRAIMSIREDDIAAQAMGVNVLYWKVMTFTISAALTGLIGAFYAHYMRFIDPSAFNFDQSVGILSMMILGGSGSIPGSFLGAVILSAIPEMLRAFSELRMVIYGLVLVLLMVFRPAGILGTLKLQQILGIEKKYARPDAIKDEADAPGKGGGS